MEISQKIEYFSQNKNEFNQINIYNLDPQQAGLGNEAVDIGNVNYCLPSTELRQIEQYFFSENVIRNICDALEYEEKILCLGTPAVADGFYKIKNKSVLLLDIDNRFDYLPGYIYFDILKYQDIKIDKPNILIIDPPFFKLSLVDLYNCVESLTEGDKKTKIIFAYVHREEKALLNIFKAYKLQLTKFKLEYRYVEPNKWENYSLYSNCEFNKIKFANKSRTSNNQISEKKRVKK
jgi:hypothetical protein